MKSTTSFRLLKASFAACALFGLAAPASAVVLYDFQGYDTGGNHYGFEFTLDTFIPAPPGDASLNVLGLPGASCMVSGNPCQSALIAFQTESFGSHDVYTVSVASAAASAQFNFVYRNPGINVFGQAGTYLADCGCDDGSATLSVGIVPVPEPASGALFALGTGMVGWSVRRRQVAVTSAAIG